VAARDTTSVRQSVRAALSASPRVVLAVSGGLDSMVLLDAAAVTVPRDRLVVATFDHGTGPSATAAAGLVTEIARGLGLDVEAGRGSTATATEATWRDARWAFLNGVAGRTGGLVCTAHTQDDQLETVLMRIMRGAHARGLAGLYARSDVKRPLIRFTRRDLVRYARSRGLTWIEDPSNDSRRFFRNRVRHELLPAMRRVSPEIDAELLRIARRAARLREEVESAARAVAMPESSDAKASLDVAAQALTSYSTESLAVLWPALAARVGVVLDRRGTDRLTAFTQAGRVGSRMQLSGGWEVVRARDRFELRRAGQEAPSARAIDLKGVLAWGTWSFRPVDSDAARSAWCAWLPTDERLEVRAWRAGDAMSVRAGRTTRKVKQLLSDAGVTGYERAHWPVVLAGDQIVWIPGVSRGDAATERSGRPGLAFSCEYDRR
jgi:tRNA(Ile)-lysidine synthase